MIDWLAPPAHPGVAPQQRPSAAFKRSSQGTSEQIVQFRRHASAAEFRIRGNLGFRGRFGDVRTLSSKLQCRIGIADIARWVPWRINASDICHSSAAGSSAYRDASPHAGTRGTAGTQSSKYVPETPLTSGDPASSTEVTAPCWTVLYETSLLFGSNVAGRAGPMQPRSASKRGRRGWWRG